MTVKELYEQVRDGRIISDIDLQREIIYNTDKQQLVIDSLVKGIPLPAFYFWKNEDEILEVLDGKQRIEAVKKFKQNDLQYNCKIWKETEPEIQTKIDNAELSIIVCEGSEKLKREIFRRINTLGVPLSRFEVINGLFNGEYLRGLSAFVAQDKDIKKILGSNSRGNNQLKVLSLIMQLDHRSKNEIENYVEKKQNESFDIDQLRLRRYFRFIVDIFDDFGHLDVLFSLSLKYIKDVSIWKENKIKINIRIKRFLKSQDSKFLNIAKEMEDIIQVVVNNISVDDKRLFTIDDKKELLLQQTPENEKYKCSNCGRFFFPEELQVDHIEPWSKGGRTVLSNAQLLCSTCNQKKGNR